MKNDAKKWGYKKIELDVWNFNKNAINFYKKLGFNTYRSFMELNNLD
jgi:ribosomal protein S18 acetylase RimI-like enzyme